MESYQLEHELTLSGFNLDNVMYIYMKGVGKGVQIVQILLKELIPKKLMNTFLKDHTKSIQIDTT